MRSETGQRPSIRCAIRATAGCRGSLSRARSSCSASPATCARKKLIPAIYDLANRGLLPPGFVPARLRPPRLGTTATSSELAREARREQARGPPFRDEVWKRLADSDPVRPRLLRRRRRLRPRWPARWSTSRHSHGIRGNAAFYLSIPPAAFPVVLKQMAAHRHGVERRSAGGWRRVVVEKPFGHDLQSARELNALVDNVFTADDVFRIDHYLGKETVQNLLALRFANTLFEPIWNTNYVDSVQITMAEDVGIGSRAGFYDTAGAARDVLQNHLLQLLALTAMEEPVSLRRRARCGPRSSRFSARSRCPTTSSTTRSAASTSRAGWPASGSPGYLDEEDIPKDSTTETYAAVRLGVETRRWAGVPFYLRTGKRLPRRVTEIAVIVQAGAAPAVRRDRHRRARPQPAGRARPAGRGRHAALRLQGARHRDGGPRRRRWTSSTARPSPSPRPRRTSG